MLSGRWGSDFKTTSYDYDSPLNEYGFETQKYYHLARLHRVLNDNAEIILKSDPKKIKFDENMVKHFINFLGRICIWEFGFCRFYRLFDKL
jgi:hypothetical protein